MPRWSELRPRARGARADLGIDVDEARALLAATTRRTSTLYASLRDTEVAVRGSRWNVGEVGAHLVGGLRGFTEAVDDDHRSVGPHIPRGGTFSDRLAAVTAGMLTVEAERDPPTLSRLITRRADEFLAATARLAPDRRIATPWYGVGATLSVAAATAMLVGEQLLHGYDVASTLGVAWPISVVEATMVIRGVTWLLPLALDPARAAGVSVAYGVTVRRGGPRFVVAVARGAATIEPGIDRRVDCRLSVDPVTFVLVGYGRVAQWGPIARGRLRAWGRRPWMALRFAGLFFDP